MKKICYFALIILTLTVYSCKKTEAGFTSDKSEAYVGEAIHFFDNDEMRKNCTFTYDFGDGSNSANNSNLYSGTGGYGGNNSNTIFSDRNPSHIYWQPGTYEVTQTIAKAGNLEKGKSKQVTAKLIVQIKAVTANFSIADTTAFCTTSTVVHFTNTTNGADQSIWAATGFGWTYVNTTDPGASTNVTAAYVGGNGSAGYANEVYITFSSPGIWKISLGVGNGFYSNSCTKKIVVH